MNMCFTHVKPFFLKKKSVIKEKNECYEEQEVNVTKNNIKNFI